MIGLHDADATNFPNLALMKISAWYKNQGYTTELYNPANTYDLVYSSKVFTFTPENAPDGAHLGGYGRGIKSVLPDHIEHICPDYDLYGLNYSLGYLTRGCSRNCDHCFVREKEGYLRPHACFSEFVVHDKVVFMDNNVLDSEHGINEIEKLSKTNIKVDFNQGLDARLITDEVAKKLSKLNWLSPLRLACDSEYMMGYVQDAVMNLRYHNCTPSRYFCYVLCRDVPETLEIVKFLKGMSLDPFVQPYIDAAGTPPTQEQKWFARWVNHKAEFKSQTWEEYRNRQLNKAVTTCL
jgi:hypothetical protein